jgi:hypothetical protein
MNVCNHGEHYETLRMVCRFIIQNLTKRLLRTQKRVIRSKVGVNSRTSCRQLFKELNILTIVSLYILGVIYYIRKHHQLVQLNSNIYAYNSRKKNYIHIQLYSTAFYARNVINVGTKLYNKPPGYIKEIESCKSFKKELK